MGTNIIQSIINFFSISYADAYAPHADIATSFICFVLIGILLPFTSLRERKSNPKYLLICLSLLEIACFSNVMFNYPKYNVVLPTFVLYILHFSFHTSIAVCFYIFTFFFIKISPIREKNQTYYTDNNKLKNKYFLYTKIAITLYVIGRIISYRFGCISINSDHTIISTTLRGPSIPYYIFMGGINLIVFFKYNNKNNITHTYVKLVCLVTFLGLCFSICVHHTLTLVTMFFIAPMIALMYYHHSYSFEVESGATDYQGLKHYLAKHLYKSSKNKISYSGTIISLFSPRNTKYHMSDIQLNIPRELKTKLFKYADKNQYIYLYPLEKEDSVKAILKSQLDKLPITYIAASFSNLNDKHIILDVLHGIFRTYHFTGYSSWIEVSEKDIEKYSRYYYIQTELIDICNKKNLDDERIITYAQPIYNTKLGIYDTAEALMRLQIPELGFIYPNEFIPIAEENQLLHTLTLIILNKVCKTIELFNKKELDIKRISVNFSMDELATSTIVDEINNITDKYNIARNQIGIEIVESTDIKEINQVINNMTTLRNLGYATYLDDFGTGYSNFSRIFSLPFDIVKFDISLLFKKDTDELGSKYVDFINNIIPSFKEHGILLVHEGVETEENEKDCIERGFDYLQGYKYSKPIEINQIEKFLSKKAL